MYDGGGWSSPSCCEGFVGGLELPLILLGHKSDADALARPQVWPPKVFKHRDGQC